MTNEKGAFRQTGIIHIRLDKQKNVSEKLVQFQIADNLNEYFNLNGLILFS